MILINLLPHREAARKRRREMFYAGLGASAAFGGLVAVGVFAWYAAQISIQENRNLTLRNEIKKLDAQIKDIAQLQEEIAALRARQQAVEDLQANRNLPVHLLNEMARLVPDGVYMNTMKQAGDTVSIAGVAQSNERVSELLRNLASGSTWLTRPELIEIVAGNVEVAPKDKRRAYTYKMTVKLVRAADAKKAASAASAAAAPKPIAAASATLTKAANQALAPADPAKKSAPEPAKKAAPEPAKKK